MTAKKTTPAARAMPQHLMRRKLFALFFVGEAAGNGTLAAQMAGFSQKTAYAKANTLLKEPDVIADIDRVRSTVLAKAEAIAVVDKARVLQELERIALCDPADFFDPITDRVLNVRNMPEHARRALRSVKVKRIGTTFEETVELSFWSKPDTLVHLGRELGLTFPTRLEHTGPGGAPIATATVELTPAERRARLGAVVSQLLDAQREGAPL